MWTINKIAKPLAIIVIYLSHSTVWAGNFDKEWFRIFGYWNGKELRADNIQLRLPEQDPKKGQVSGRIDKIDLQNHTLQIGPFLINWSKDTRFELCQPEQLKVGKTIKVSGTVESNRLTSRKIALEATPYAPGSLQVFGLSSISTERADGIHEFTVLNIPVYTPQNGYNTFKSLIRRQDVRRPDDQFKFNLLGKPVTIGGEYDLNPGFRDNLDLDKNDPDGSMRLDQELKLEAFYPISNFTAVFLSFKGITESRFNVDSDTTDQTRVELARDETWIYFDRIAGTGFGLQFGNQNVSETREWWWDKDMDSLRLYYNRGPLHFELTGGKQIGGESTQRSIDPEEDEIYRVMGLGSWMWNSKQRLELYFLKQWDRSTVENEGNVIKRLNRDTNDQDMAWFGGRAIGEIGLSDYGSLNYWADVAGVYGDETVTEYDSEDGDGNDLPDSLRRVDKVNRNDVSGWAFDVGAFWTLPVKFEPTFTLSYARASGDDNPNDGHNSTFRQTGIQRNNWRFNGVNRFRIYGELLRPELSNMGIFTSSFGIRLLKNSSIEFVYHKYDQVEAIDNLRNANINADPNGIDRDIGQEVNVIANFREWKNLELGVEGAVFDPGKAFGTEASGLAYSIFLDVNYNF
ncbi:alginate export family protein [Methyloglobulus sp.]|uniref:alginate export family protein n=1 Tax=Methyloglobulus sp. TaxID=2518622 RepID=UPI0032B70D59